MIYYVILLSGLSLLLLSNLKWMKIKKSVSDSEKTRSRNIFFMNLFLKKMFSEWLHYCHEITKEKK